MAEGGFVQLTGFVSDAGTTDTHTIEWDLDGDGTFGETGANATRGDEAGSTPTFNAAGLDGATTFDVSLSVTDDDGAISSIDTTMITVTNVAPSVDANDGEAHAVAEDGDTAPAVATEIPDQSARADQSYSFTLSDDTFRDRDDDPLTLSVAASGSAALPTWLSFNASTSTFSGSPTSGDVGGVDVTVTADDGNGGSTSGTFTLTVRDAVQPTDSAGIVAVGAGFGSAPGVQVFDATTGTEVRPFLAYSPAFRGGVSVAVADVTGDGTVDIVTGAASHGGPHVRVFDGETGERVRNFFALIQASTAASPSRRATSIRTVKPT